MKPCGPRRGPRALCLLGSISHCKPGGSARSAQSGGSLEQAARGGSGSLSLEWHRGTWLATWQGGMGWWLHTMILQLFSFSARPCRLHRLPLRDRHQRVQQRSVRLGPLPGALLGRPLRPRARAAAAVPPRPRRGLRVRLSAGHPR